MKRAIVLFSGGLDSTACLYWAKERYEKIILLSFCYGSKEDQAIVKANNFFTNHLGIENKIITLPFLAEFSERSGSALSKNKGNVPVFQKQEALDDLEISTTTAKSVWVPARNVLFLSIAAALGDSYNKSVDIIFGANKEEGTTFPDNTSEFVERMNKSLELGCNNQIRILGPFSDYMKSDIALFLVKKGAKIEHSSSCYDIRNWTSDNQPIHCGECESCQRRKRAFIKAKIADATFYAK